MDFTFDFNKNQLESIENILEEELIGLGHCCPVKIL